MSFEGWEFIGTGIGIVVGTTGITKWMLTNAVRSIKHHCGMQKEVCAERCKAAAQDRKRLRQDIDRHGHKALDQNGSKVTI